MAQDNSDMTFGAPIPATGEPTQQPTPSAAPVQAPAQSSTDPNHPDMVFGPATPASGADAGKITTPPPRHPELEIGHGFVPVDKTTGKVADPGVWNSLKRTVYGPMAGMYHAFSDPVTNQEKQEILDEIRDHNRQNPKGAIPEDVASNPGRGYLAYKRLVEAPANVAWEKGKDEQKAAEDLWKNRDYWRGGNAYLSGLADKLVGPIPFVGPAITGAAERMEKGDVSGGAADVAGLVAYSNLDAGAKAIAQKLGIGGAPEPAPEGAPYQAGKAAGEATAKAGSAVADVAKKGVEAFQTPKPKTPEEAAGKIFQAKEQPGATTGDRGKAVAAMEALKQSRGTVADLDTPEKIRGALEKQIDDNTKKVDALLGQNERVYTPDELDQRFPVQNAGGMGVEVRNPALDAMDDLTNYYDGMRDVESKAKMITMKNKFTQQGLSLQELNQLARDLGSALVDDKSFDKSGNLRTGQNAQALEQTRSSLKQIVRDKMPDDEVRNLDEVTSYSIRSRALLDKLITDVQSVNNKLQRASTISKAVGHVATAADVLTGKLVSTIMKKFLSGTEDTTLNPAQIVDQLPKTIRVLDEMLDPGVRPDEALRQVQVMTAEPEPGPKEQGAEPGALAQNLPLSFEEPHMDRTPAGMDTKAVLNHELGHAVVAHSVGFNPIDVWSEEHPNSPKGVYATTRMHWGELDQNRAGLLDLSKLRNRLDDVLTTHLAGAAANDLYDGIPRDQNKALVGDMKQARELTRLLGMTPEESEDVLDNAFARAKSILADEKVSDVINEFSDTREPNLPSTHHYSAARILNLLDRIDEARNESTETRPDERSPEQRPASESAGARTPEAGAVAAESLPQGTPAATATPEIAPERVSPGGHVISVPPERTTGVYDDAIRKGGGIPGGIQKGDADIDIPDLALFHDPETGSTLALKVGDVTSETVTDALTKSRAQFAAAARPQVKPFNVEWKPNGKYGVVNPKGITLQEFPTREAAESAAQQMADQSARVKAAAALANLHAESGFSGKAADFVNKDYLPEDEGEDSGMYHVTTAKDKVLAEGLKSRKQSGVVGLGGGLMNMAPDKVSVTFDAGHASTIADRMRLAIRAAKGEVAPRQVLDHMISDAQIADDTPHEVASALNAPESVRESEDWEPFEKWFDETYPNNADSYELLQELDDALPRIYSEASNPVRVGFTASKAQMAKLDPDQVEVLHVEARKGAKAEHVPEEAELRFKPEDVKVLKPR